MTNQGNFKYNWKKFDDKFWDFVNKEIPKRGLEGLFAGANEALDNAIEPEYPQAPKDEGHLWGSKKIDKIGIIQATKEILVVFGFNIAYARKWHELPKSKEEKTKWTISKGATVPGRKFLEAKLVKYAKRYIGIASDHIRKKARVK